MTKFANIIAILGRDHKDLNAFVLAKTQEYAELEKAAFSSCVRVPSWEDFLNDQSTSLHAFLTEKGKAELPSYPEVNLRRSSVTAEQLDQLDLASMVWGVKNVFCSPPSVDTSPPINLRTFYAPTIALWEARGGLVIPCDEGLAFTRPSPQNIQVTAFLASKHVKSGDEEAANYTLLKGEIEPRSSQFRRAWDSKKVHLSEEVQEILDAWTEDGNWVFYINNQRVALRTSRGEAVCYYEEWTPDAFYREHTAPTPAALLAMLRGHSSRVQALLETGDSRWEMFPANLNEIHQILATRALFYWQREHKKRVAKAEEAHGHLVRAEEIFNQLLGK